jgi:hypothetical protein
MKIGNFVFNRSRKYLLFAVVSFFLSIFIGMTRHSWEAGVVFGALLLGLVLFGYIIWNNSVSSK